MKNWFWLLFWNLLVCNGLAQSPLIISGKTPYIPVGSGHVLFWEDKTHGVSLAAFRQMPDAKLSPAPREYVNFGVTNSAFWLKFKLLNQTGKPIFLRTLNPTLDTAHLYVYAGKKLLLEKDVLSTKPEIYLPNAPFSLPTSADTLTCYLRVFAKVPCVVAMYVLPEKHMTKVIFDQAIPDLLFFGAVLVMVVYNLFIGIATRNRVYFYYVLYSISVGLATFFFKAYPVAILAKNHGIINDNFAIIASMMPICLCLFTIEFLQIKARYKWGYRLLLAGIGVHILDIIIFLLGFTALNVVLYQPFSIFSNTAVILVSLRLYKSYRPARIFFFAFLSYVILSSCVVLMFLDIIPITLPVFYFLHIGASIELTLFSIALADKINLYRKEKEVAQRKTIELIQEQNTVLEQKVQERTLQLKEANEELQQINEELHSTLDLVEVERQKSDALLLNILPAEVANELKETGKTDVRYFECVTVLFADVKGFSALATKISPQALIAELDATFSKMDEISLRFGLERIKTIGDCYMACGGLPHANKTHAFDAILAALHIQEWMKEEHARRQGDFWQVRLGAHTGDAVAGVIGKTKFAYDIWGNTVNLASRMESGGEVGKVNVTEATFNLVKAYFEGDYREEIEAKNIGKIKAYFITRLKPEFSADAHGLEPNELFLRHIITFNT